MKEVAALNKGNSKVVSYNKWGYIFLIPFVVIFIIFQLIPLASTFYYSTFEYYKNGLAWVGPKFVGLENYKALVGKGNLLKYAGNTLTMWIMGFIPQIALSLLLGSWFANTRLKLKGSQFFKTVIYMPNLIMASAFSMLFFALFSTYGPINGMLVSMGFLKTNFDFFSNTWSVRWLVAFMNFVMWFGNTTILLMAGMLSIDSSLYEAAEVDGATPTQVFWRITIPILRPILVYVVITSLIGGIQMFDVPQILTNGSGQPNNTTMTLIMGLNKHLFSKNYGAAGSLSVVLFFITTVLSLIVFKFQGNGKEK